MDWNVDRVIAIVGIGAGIVLAAIAIGVGLGMDTRTQGELRFVQGCFLFSALALFAPVAFWAIHTDLSSLKRWGIVGSASLLIGICLVEGLRWANGRHTPEISTALSPVVIEWNDPAPIVEGTALSATQLNAKANVEGDASYSPKIGDVLPAGVHGLTVNFAPEETQKYARTSKTVHLTVEPARGKTLPKKPSSIPPTQGEKPPTLLDLYQKDMPQMMKVHKDGDAVGISWDDGTITHIKEQVYLDFDARTKFVGFYISAANPMVSTQTAQACLILNQNDAVQKAINDLSERIMLTGGRADQMTNAKDLTFSGRVLIYHEAYLSITEKASIIHAYAAKNQDVQFRGPDYLGDAVAGWYMDHGMPKPKRQ